MNIQIRPYSSEDAPSVKKCIFQLKQIEGDYDPDFFTDTTAVNKLFLKILEKIGEKGAVFVAETNDEVVGFISLQVENKNDPLICKKVDCVYISDIAVLENYRGVGIGMKLLQAGEKYAQVKKIKYLKLNVCAKNQKAMDLYQRFGFHDYEAILLKTKWLIKLSLSQRLICTMTSSSPVVGAIEKMF
jgi:ribosomal protein S18 acetylase RimI-like enzyme